MGDELWIDEHDQVAQLATEKPEPLGLPLFLAALVHLALFVFIRNYGLGPPALNFVLKQPQVSALYQTVHLIYNPTAGTGVGGGGGGGGKESVEEAPKSAVKGPEISRTPMRRAEPPATPTTVEPVQPQVEPPRVQAPVTLPGGNEDRAGVVVEEAPPTAVDNAGGSGTGGGIGSGTGPGTGSGSGPGIGPGRGGGTGGGPYRPGGGVSMPVLIHEEKARYPDEAKRHFTTGIVILEAVVTAGGTVGDIRIIRALPDGCVESAIAALRRWRFLPGRKDGMPVDTLFLVTFTFS